MVSQEYCRLIGPGLPQKVSKQPSPPLFLIPKNRINTLYHINYSRIHHLQSSKRRKSKMSQHHTSDNINSFNTNLINNVWNYHTAVDEKSEILAWLSPLEPQRRHHDIRTRRVKEVGDWLLQTEEYRNWLGGIGGGKSDSTALFCYGGPEVGKTYIR